MKVAIHINHMEHQQTHGVALRDGFRRHGIEPTFSRFNIPAPCDVAVVWGWRQHRVVAAIKDWDGHVLVSERGYLGDRFAWTSLGWDGLNGLARFPEPADHGERFARHFGRLLQPWRSDGDYVLLCGQVDGDAALHGADVRAWAAEAVRMLGNQPRPILYRPHPGSIARGDHWCPAGIEASDPASSTLVDDLEHAALCVTYNSNSGVEAVLAGVPTVAMHRGSMAWGVSSHDLTSPPAQPDRHEWCRRLAWCQWTLDEISDGTAWAHVREAIR